MPSCRRRVPKPIGGLRRSAAVPSRSSCGALEAITGRWSYRTAPTKRCGPKRWRRPGTREWIRATRSPISRRRRRRSKARAGSRWCSRSPAQAMCRRRSGRSSRPVSAFDRSSRRPTPFWGWRDRDRRLPCRAGSKRMWPSTPPARASPLSVMARCSARASCRGGMKTDRARRLRHGARKRCRAAATIWLAGSSTSSRRF